MRTPVSGILMLCRESGLDPAAVIWTQQVSQQARQTLEMMDGFIHAIRADAERYELTQQFFDSLLEQSLHEVRTLATERGNTFDVDQGAFLYLMCDPRLIERVLVNLFVNAIRYSLMNTTITVRVTVDADETDRPYLVCRIENVINDEAQQGPKEIEQKGFGLGLAFVQQVVNGHAGTFEQDFSGPNGLAVVTLRLPCLALI
jgi:signal transduction histidine kinase